MKSGHTLVVGGSTGIGYEIAARLRAREQAVTVASRTPGVPAGLDGVEPLILDTAAEKIELDGVPEVLDGLVYCPGTIRLKPFRRLTAADLLADLHVNYLGAVKTIQACLTRLRKSKAGASVVLFSTVAVATGMPFHASIAGAKGAVEGLTRSLAAEFAPHIRFNAIAPSLTDTPLAKDLLSSEEKRQAAAERHPLKRVGQPGEIAAAAVYLLSEDSGWITGQVIPVDGGMSSIRTFR